MRSASLFPGDLVVSERLHLLRPVSASQEKVEALEETDEETGLSSRGGSSWSLCMFGQTGIKKKNNMEKKCSKTNKNKKNLGNYRWRDQRLTGGA